MDEVDKLKPETGDVRDLAAPVLSYLTAFSDVSSKALLERLEKLEANVEK